MPHSTPVSQLYDRRGVYPFPVPEQLLRCPIKVAVVYSVCYRFRLPIFLRLANHPALKTRFYFGQGMHGTKLSNAKNRSGLDHRVLFTLAKRVISTGREVVLQWNPTLFFHLLTYGPDVLLIQGGELLNNMAMLLYARLTRTPVAWWSLGEVRDREYKGASRLYREWIKWIESKSTVWLGYSSISVDYFVRQGYNLSRCFNLINIVDTERVCEQAASTNVKARELRNELGCSDRLMVLFVGTMTREKRIERLLHAYARLANYHDKTRLVLVGDGPIRTECEKLAGQLLPPGQAIFLGDIFEGVAAYFQAANLVVVPGTGGLVVSEAMAHGLPVISSVGDGVEVDLILPGCNGDLIGPDSVEELAHSLETCLSDPERLRAMGQASLRRIQESYNIDRYMNELLAGIITAYEVGKWHWR